MNVKQKLMKFVSKLPMLSNEDWHELNELLIKEVCVPKSTIIDSRPFEREDFQLQPNTGKECLQILNDIFSNYTKSDFSKFPSQPKILYSTILFCGEHISENLWTDDDCTKLANTIVNHVLRISECNSLSSFLKKPISERKLNGMGVFIGLLPKLSKESWRYYPAAVKCFSWLLHHIQMPNMKCFINLVLPVPLNFLEDYMVENKITGLNCLCHILRNMSKAELEWCIELKLLQDILKPLLYYREAELIVPLTKCILEVAEKSKSEFVSLDLNWSYFDDVLSIFLPMMEYEQDIERRKAYGQSLCLIIEFNNLSIARWTAKLLLIIEDYSKYSINELQAVMALNLYIRTCWPVVHKHWKKINLIAGKIIYASNDKECVKTAELTLKLLKEILSKDVVMLDVEDIKSRKKNYKT